MKGGNRDAIIQMGQACGYALEQEQDNIKLLIFVNSLTQINVYYTKMTVATCLRHPKRGATQLFRRCVSMQEMERIFKKPRLHTGKGYY